MKSSQRLAIVTVVAVLTGGCGLLPQFGTPTSASTPSSVAGTATATPPPSSTSPVTTPALATVPPTTSGPQALEVVVLSGSSVDAYAMGAPVSAVQPALIEKLGEPTQTAENSGCEMNPTWTRTLMWNDLRVVFTAHQATKTASLTLTAWELREPFALPAKAVLVPPYTTDLTLDDLVKLYPGTTTSPFGSGGDTIADTGNGVFYFYPSAAAGTKPALIAGGALLTCE